ncbi:unnamed protein product [Cladocopium goreaui]|uniref:Fibronectin type-III domain-containing protein n=1 Tax=Cladocopium goreaui TaxID=2562237 RepID=A0A9P1DRZ9_9DINO|nr:unnamed protein product [Cladocopium goreaui]
MTSYVVRITETCTDVRTNSLPADTPTFRFREVDDWEIYVGPSAGMTLAVSTLSKEVDHCEVITTCCDDQFSLCYSTTSTEELTASVSRTDFVAGYYNTEAWDLTGSATIRVDHSTELTCTLIEGSLPGTLPTGWGQQLWLHCFANGINPLSTGPRSHSGAIAAIAPRLGGMEAVKVDQ